MEKRLFVTMMVNCNALGITKDVGQIPYSMYKYHGYNSYLVTYNNDDYQKWIDEYTPGIKVKYLKKRSENSEFFDEVRFLFVNAKKIDVLNMYHMSVEHLICLCIYKILNPRGISYLKLDIDYQGLDGHSKLAKWKKKIIAFLHQGVDIISAESSIACEKYDDIFGIKPIYIPSGFADIQVEPDALNLAKKISKEKIIITAGRLGTKQKATEVLLEAFAKAQNVNNWRLVLAGPVTKELKEWLQKFYDNNPNIKDKVIFTGNITDKNELYNLMGKSSIFALPSRWGGSEIAAVEALSEGNYLILSEGVPPCEEYTNHGKYGITVPADNIDAWADAIDNAIIKLSSGYDYIDASNYGKSNFNWKNITQKLADTIKENNDKNKKTIGI
ncbi:glycosyltransferase family 4 protein [Butyrivibrio sp. TB]|uniref:glycosyltransferase family 4 protein n=1 Tax=Butyrivibrio sp. TB TaxID=1520809 RepID=UPI0008CD281B|nr:glycosyltransferase [Butyrivibrio sp. TB]SEP94977.1 Glycosyltransferase involved in cell wall bisynthesis [Butyrivibrio sp. TB]